MKLQEVLNMGIASEMASFLQPQASLGALSQASQISID